MSVLLATGDFLWDNSPEVRQIANVLGLTHPLPRRRCQDPEPEEPRPKKKKRYPKRAWREEPPEDIIDMVMGPDGSYSVP
jgi:hypothetical protein